MQDFYDQIVGRPEDDIIGSAAAQWLNFPGCVFVKGEFRADPDGRAVVAPGLFITVTFDDGAGRGILTRVPGGERQMTAIAVREALAVERSVHCAEHPAIGLALPRASIDELGLGDEFRALFASDGSDTATVALTASARIQTVAAEMFSPPVAGNAAQLLRSAHAAEIVVHALFGERGRIAVDPAADLQRMRLQSVKERMDADLAYPWSIDELARSAGLSRRSFNQKFQMAYGVSAIDYLRGQRLDAARALLIRQRLSVTEAAYRVGYAHPANFATAFRRRFGYSPSRCQQT
ncbi:MULTISPECIES: helix-turn-helix transcriptional regulator [Bradyrhizobium]|uniref:helix-turn-helix transcriptional regulator n=1 Tax=Bradyrhizobium TaxID=374 RepID=UPI000424E50A|nr:MULTISPECIES: AraC family transcriptional regulator [Bradyrhizobium]QOG16496.1 helix-turn-helix domain-containing protein [Bradyrhizobium sp. SEMIA]UFW49307.1 AraC family transcriptional regulator [Bradyrhizobium arachidis]